MLDLKTSVHFHSNCCQHATGTFTVAVVPGTNHCGLDDNQGHFRYEVLLEFRGEPLDKSGFLLDNTAFQNYFDNLAPLAISCEQLAETTELAFVSMLGDRAAFLKSVSVKIFPFADMPDKADTYVEAEMEPNA